MIKSFAELIDSARKGSKVTVAIAAAADEAALGGMAEAHALGIADGVLFGDARKIRSIYQEMTGTGEVPFPIQDLPDEGEALRAAVGAVRSGAAQILLKGSVKTAVLLKAVLDNDSGLRSSHLLSDLFIFEDPTLSDNQLMMITDGGVTLKPDLKQKIEIIENAVAVAHALGNENPRIAVLSAVETVNPALPATVDAAVLSKMNQRGQIKGCLIDGPLALDNAISPEAARIKGIMSPVAGRADILLCPDIESANMLAKSTTYFARLRLGHVIMGSTAPVLIPSRADSADSKALSIAIGKLVCTK
ncbi:MAG TPA: bifunctional enoyl-CoA hydratase/phosphate acetyltransferase [bacterium]|nr:bifunctional enoyl-CoA hydratase/phosphate acetyltransferase [bacterium]HQI50280.1 bifunctional enoyl-CoA hydratase/phosphate acetyltransferase [bacterium]HQJ64706.1 bifunctional enoyl-CoA hydratase/phosphate acetyltransferase [bacterium]